MSLEMGPSVPGLSPEYAVFLPQVYTEDQPPTYLETRKVSIPTVEPPSIDHLISWALRVFIKGSEFREAFGEVIRRFRRLG